MRGEPKIATKQDVLNVANDLDPTVALKALRQLKKKDRRKMGISEKEWNVIMEAASLEAAELERLRSEMEEAQARIKEGRAQIKEKTTELRLLHAELAKNEAERDRLTVELQRRKGG